MARVAEDVDALAQEGGLARPGNPANRHDTVPRPADAIDGQNLLFREMGVERLVVRAWIELATGATRASHVIDHRFLFGQDGFSGDEAALGRAR